jgi:alkylhydroperoxidase family enzyme
MAFVRQIEPDEATGKLQRIYQAAVLRAGGVANIIRVMSLDPDVCQASMAMYTSTMKRTNCLTPRVREMIATVVSNVNDCYY